MKVRIPFGSWQIENTVIKNSKLFLVVILIASGCASVQRAFPIPTVWQPAKPRGHQISDYPEALSSIASVMAGDLGLPAVEGTVTLYPNSTALESALALELERDFREMAEIIEKQLGPQAKERFRANQEEGIALAARQHATTAVAVTLHKRILVNELLFLRRYSWPERIRVLAHELTHTVEKAFVNGRVTTTDHWMMEGFADWVSYKVLDSLGLDTFAKSRERSVNKISNARQYQTFPLLSQLARRTDWNTWGRALGHEATYGQAFMAVDFLIDQKGLPAVIEYFRLFGKVRDRERNFATAFAEPLSSFEQKFSKHLEVLLGK
jgi:hypothetical protein